MNSDFTMFDQLVLDPDLSVTVPRDKFYTGIDTYMHCFESLTGHYRNTVVDARLRRPSSFPARSSIPRI